MFSTQWEHDQGVWVYSFSALSADGVALWGSQVVDSNHPPIVFELDDIQPPYAVEFEFTLPTPPGEPWNTYAYSVAEGPEGLTVDRKTGELSWRPSLLDAGISQPVVIRALSTEAGDPDEFHYTFVARATSPTVINRRDLPFDAIAEFGLQDAAGQHTGLIARLPGTGGALPEHDPKLLLDPATGVLNLDTAQADFFGQAGLDAAGMPGLPLAELDFTGNEDFAVRAVFRPLPGLEFIDQVGLYVGTDSATLTRAGTIVFRAPERYSAHTQNGLDHSARFSGFGFDGSDGMSVTINREAGQRRYFVDGVEWNPLGPTAFLDGLADLTASVFAITPLNANVKTVDIEEITAVVATGEPCPAGADGSGFGCAD